MGTALSRPDSCSIYFLVKHDLAGFKHFFDVRVAQPAVGPKNYVILELTDRLTFCGPSDFVQFRKRTLKTHAAVDMYHRRTVICFVIVEVFVVSL